MRRTHLVFDGRDLSDMLYVTNIERPMVAKRDAGTVEVSGVPGAHLQSAALKTSEITVTARILADAPHDITEKRRILSGLLYTEGPAHLILPDEPDKYYLAIYEGGAEPSRLVGWPEVELKFLAPDPVAFGQIRVQDVTGRETVHAGGTWESRPVVTATPPACKKWTIRNVGSGDFVTVAADFDGTALLELDMDLERCRINGTDHAVVSESDFFAIRGTQDISVSAGTAELTWRERWL